MTNNPLAYRFIIFNACAAAGIVWATKLGYVEQVFNGDISGISYGITALFIVGLISSARFVYRLPEHAAQSDHIGAIAEWLVTLGLIGNVVGFVLALHGLDANSLANGAQKVAAQLLAGMGVAFYSTLAGAVLALWTSVNKRMIDTALAVRGDV